MLTIIFSVISRMTASQAQVCFTVNNFIVSILVWFYCRVFFLKINHNCKLFAQSPVPRVTCTELLQRYLSSFNPKKQISVVPNMPKVVVCIKLSVNSWADTKPILLDWEICSVNSGKEAKILKKRNRTHFSTPPGVSTPLCPVLAIIKLLNFLTELGLVFLAVETALYASGSTESERALYSSAMSNISWRNKRQKLFQCGDTNLPKGKGADFQNPSF